jgi:hypothetical protein
MHAQFSIHTKRTAASPATDPSSGSTDVVSVVMGVNVSGNAGVRPLTAITTVRWVCGETGLVRAKEKLRSVPARRIAGPAKEMIRMPDCAQFAGEVRGAVQTMEKAALSGVALPAGAAGGRVRATKAGHQDDCCSANLSLGLRRIGVCCVAGSVAALT